MADSSGRLISFVIPLFNEAAGLTAFQKSLMAIIHTLDYQYEIIYCDDGSSDNTVAVVRAIRDTDSHVKLLCLSRNFGKEAALSAGIAEASGDAVISLDGDGQHPLDRIPDFVKAWEKGAQVVVGVGRGGRKAGWLKLGGSKLFHSLFNRIASQKMIHGSTDFRLIDRVVQQAFIKLTETDRITRGLIDWLGFKREIIKFQFKARESGNAGYSTRKLIGLAANIFVSLTPVPLYVFGYVGIAITGLSFLLGSSVIVEQLILGDPLKWNFTGTAMLGILNSFLVGLVLMSIGILSLYISRMQNQGRRRPLYIIDDSRSMGIKK